VCILPMEVRDGDLSSWPLYLLKSGGDWISNGKGTRELPRMYSTFSIRFQSNGLEG
jgi:hypothetical protein